jgi:hypothetical protein
VALLYRDNPLLRCWSTMWKTAIELSAIMQEKTLTLVLPDNLDVSWLPDRLTLSPLQAAAFLEAIRATMPFPPEEGPDNPPTTPPHPPTGPT